MIAKFPLEFILNNSNNNNNKIKAKLPPQKNQKTVYFSDLY